MAITTNDLALSDLINMVMLEAGQYIIDLDSSLLSEKDIITLATRELTMYSRYIPQKVNLMYPLYDGKVFQIPVDGFIPDQIVGIETNNYYIAGLPLGAMPGAVHSFNWRYDKPTLYLRYPADNYFLTYISKYTYDPVNKCFTNLLSTQHYNYFVDLVAGRVMMTIGRARAAFKMPNMPIETNADALVSEGKELYNAATGILKSNSKYYLTVII